jgi:hypothetical protein
LSSSSDLAFCLCLAFDRLLEFLFIRFFLEDEQGLSMGEMLTVKIRQPSHEFTFGVGMSFIPYPLVLTPVI